MFGQAVTGVLVPLAAGSPVQQVADAATDELLLAVPITVGAIAVIAAAAFGIKGIWVAWRGGSKAVGKTGT